MNYRQPDAGDESSGEQRPGGSLTKVTVNLVPKAAKALYDVSDSTGDTKTECINRAIQVYAWLTIRMNLGERVVVVEKDGTSRQIQIF